MGKNHPYYRKNMSTNFAGSPHAMGFVTFSHTMGNRWGNPCISHMMKYTIGWESDGKKYPYYGKSMSTNFPGFPHTMGFVAFFSVLWEIDGKIHAFPMVNFFLCLKTSIF